MIITNYCIYKILILFGGCSLFCLWGNGNNDGDNDGDIIQATGSHKSI
jgi:hypothetical protein